MRCLGPTPGPRYCGRRHANVWIGSSLRRRTAATRRRLRSSNGIIGTPLPFRASTYESSTRDPVVFDWHGYIWAICMAKGEACLVD